MTDDNITTNSIHLIERAIESFGKTTEDKPTSITHYDKNHRKLIIAVFGTGKCN